VISYNNGKQAVTSVLVGSDLTADFGSDGKLAGSAGCNNYSGGYEIDGDKITIAIGFNQEVLYRSGRRDGSGEPVHGSFTKRGDI